MMKKTLLRLIQIYAVWAVSLLGINTISAVADAPPAMPHVFDRETVQQLINNAELNQNNVILKFGYFATRARHTLPASEGLSLLKVNLQKEPVASKKWFFLNSIYAFAAFRVNEGTRHEGYIAYDALFAQHENYEEAGVTALIQDSIYEFTVTLSGNLGPSRFGKEDSTDTALQALKTYLQLIESDKVKRIQIPWASALREYESKDFIDLVEASLKKPAALKNYSLLVTAASVIQSANPIRAIELLHKAKPFLNRANGEEIEWFYRTLAGLFVESERLSEAAQLQREYIELTGKGRVGLLKTYLRQQNKDGVLQVLEELSSPQASEDEVMEAAAVLGRLGEDPPSQKTAKEQQTSLLSSYLSPARKRNLESELQARLLMAKSLIIQGKTAAAKDVLKIKPFGMDAASSVAKYRYASMQRMLEQIEQAEEKRTPIAPK